MCYPHHMAANATVRKLGTAAVFVLLVTGLWVGLSLLPERAPGERRQLADLFDRAEAGEGRGRLVAAEAAYREALALAEKLQDAKAQIAARIGMARLAAARDHLAEAATALAPALPLARQLNAPERTATVLNNLGEIARARGDLDEAKRRLDEALGIAGAQGRTRAAVLNNLGEIARAERQLDRALAYYQEAKALNEEVGYMRGLAANLANIGATHLAQGQAQEAVRWLVQGQRAAFEADDRLTMPAILTTLSQAYAAAGNTEGARASLMEARDRYLFLGLESKAAALTREMERLRKVIEAPAAAAPGRPPEAPEER